MKSLSFGRLVIAASLFTALLITASGQQSAVTAPPSPKGMVVEVTYFKGRAFAYQRVGEWTWYEMFQRPADWKPREGEVPVAAVKITPRLEDGVIKARITVLRGPNHETEDFVGEHTLSAEKKTTVRELSGLGVEPFELQLVRAPSTVADPPSVVNKTKSLQVIVEPKQSSLPTFSARILNNSSKPVATFAYYTSIDGVKKLSGSSRNEEGGALIKPGDSFQRTFRYPMKLSTVSTGEVPPAVSNLVFNVTSVVFTDGTYEGDAFAAANFLAVNAGEKLQLRSFLDMVRAKEFNNSPAEIETAILSVNVDTVAGEIVQKFPALSGEEKARLRSAVDFGKSLGVKLFRDSGSAPTAALVERLQKRIELLP